MKKQTFLIGTLALLLLMGSCKKKQTETEAADFSANIEADGNSKTHLDALKVKWDAGDIIRVYGSTGDNKDYTLQTGQNTQLGTFSCGSGGVKEGNNFWGFYPIGFNPSRSGDVFTFTTSYTNTQTYLATGFADEYNPMVAKVTDGSHVLPFKNVFSILKVEAVGNSAITKVRLTSNNKLSGTYTVDAGTMAVSKSGADGSNTIEISYSTTLSSTVTNFYFLVPPGTNNYTVEFYNGNTRVGDAIIKNNVSMTAGHMKKLAADMTQVFKYKVSASQYVTASPGNLRKTSSRWEFQGEQWYFDGPSIGNGLSGNKTDAHVGFSYFQASNNLSNYGIDLNTNGTTFIDWGNNSIYNPKTGNVDAANTWRTLSYSEFSYLINENPHRVFVNVNGVEGTIIMPNDWSGNISSSYSGSSWTSIESQGAVFLPHTGRIQNENGTYYYYNTFENNHIMALYWTNEYQFWTPSWAPSTRYFEGVIFWILESGSFERQASNNWCCQVRLFKNVN